MRITILIEATHVDDAAIVLETLGFVPDDAVPVEPRDGIVTVTGEFPEKNLSELAAVAGISDWKVLPLATGSEGEGWPWNQMPETD